jgi:hypothetical protein
VHAVADVPAHVGAGRARPKKQSAKKIRKRKKLRRACPVSRRLLRGWFSSRRGRTEWLIAAVTRWSTSLVRWKQPIPILSDGARRLTSTLRPFYPFRSEPTLEVRHQRHLLADCFQKLHLHVACNRTPTKRTGYPQCAGFAGASSCGDHPNLHAGDGQAGVGGAESAGSEKRGVRNAECAA